MFEWDFLYFSLHPFLSSFHRYSLKVLLCLFSLSTHQVIYTHYKISPNCLLQLNSAGYHFLLCMSIKHLGGPTLNSNILTSFLYLEAQNCTQDSGFSLIALLRGE